MSWEYTCPRCEAMLNPDRSVMLNMSRGEVECLIGLHPMPGKYEIHLPPNVTAEDGTRWEFSCPSCRQSLTTVEDPNLCELALTLEGERMRILFSCVAGEHATFICHEDTPCESFGEDAGRYKAAAQKKKAAAQQS